MQERRILWEIQYLHWDSITEGASNIPSWHSSEFNGDTKEKRSAKNQTVMWTKSFAGLCSLFSVQSLPIFFVRFGLRREGCNWRLLAWGMAMVHATRIPSFLPWLGLDRNVDSWIGSNTCHESQTFLHQIFDLSINMVKHAIVGRESHKTTVIYWYVIMYCFNHNRNLCRDSLRIVTHRLWRDEF